MGGSISKVWGHDFFTNKSALGMMMSFRVEEIMYTYLTMDTFKPFEASKFQVHQHVTSEEPIEEIILSGTQSSWIAPCVFAGSLDLVRLHSTQAQDL